MPILSAAMTALPGPISINTVVPMNSAPKARTSASSAGPADEDSGMGPSFEPAAAITPVAPPSRAPPKGASPLDDERGPSAACLARERGRHHPRPAQLG